METLSNVLTLTIFGGVIPIVGMLICFVICDLFYDSVYNIFGLIADLFKYVIVGQVIAIAVMGIVLGIWNMLDMYCTCG